MPVISICSPKGGVGKTTLSANLAHVFAQAGTKVVAVDFDPQNAMRLYFGIPLSDERGHINKVESDSDWIDSVMNVGKNLFVLPFGKSTNEQRTLLDRKLADPGYLKNYQSSIFCNPEILVICDFPPGFSMALKAITAVTDVTLIPLLADAASITLFTQIQSGQMLDRPFDDDQSYYLVLNHVDNRIKLNREIQDFVQTNFADHLLGMIHADTSVLEAAALQQPIRDFNHNSAAGFDIEIIARKLAHVLGFEVRQGTMTINPNR